MLERLDLRDAVPQREPFQVDWQAMYRKLPNTEGEIIFAGDSLVASGPWAEFYPPSRIAVSAVRQPPVSSKGSMRLPKAGRTRSSS